MAATSSKTSQNPDSGAYESISNAPKTEDDRYVNGEWDDVGLWRRWTFTVSEPMIFEGLKSPLQPPQLMQLPYRDRASKLTERITTVWNDTENSHFIAKYGLDVNHWFMPRLIKVLIQTFNWQFIKMMILTFVEGATRISAALVIRFLLEELMNSGDTTTSGGSGKGDYTNAYLYAILLGTLTTIQTVVHHVLFFYSMRMGWNWKIGYE
jgi:hypothetical protein